MLKFSEIRDYVLTPGAILFVTFSGRGLCKTPEEMIDFLASGGEVDRDVLSDFVYDRTPLTDDLAECFGDFSCFWDSDGDIRQVYDGYVKAKENPDCLVITVDDIFNQTIQITEEDVGRLSEAVKSYCADRSKIAEEMDELYEMMKKAHRKLCNLACFADRGFFEERMVEEEELQKKYNLLKTLGFQREFNLSQSGCGEQDRLSSSIRSLPSLYDCLDYDICGNLERCWKLAIGVEAFIEGSFWKEKYFDLPFVERLRLLWKSAVSRNLLTAAYNPEYDFSLPPEDF